MTDPSGPTPEPGWYPDPWDANQTRYWDGSQWTGWANPAPGTSTTAAVPPTPTAAISRRACESAAKCARWGIIIVAANAVIIQLSMTLIASGFATIDFRSFGSSSTTSDPSGPSGLGVALIIIGFIVQTPLQFSGIAVLVLLVFWAYRIAQNGQALGIPARRSPGWAIGGWFIPIVSLWFPYESISDALPADRRPSILRWWLMYCLAPLAGFPLVLAMFGLMFLGSALLVGAVGIAGLALVGGLQWFQVRWGLEVAERIRTEQYAIGEAHGLLVE